MSATGTVIKYHDLYLQTWYVCARKERRKSAVAKMAKANDGV
jgi:hypothetical protein